MKYFKEEWQNSDQSGRKDFTVIFNKKQTKRQLSQKGETTEI